MEWSKVPSVGVKNGVRGSQQGADTRGGGRSLLGFLPRFRGNGCSLRKAGWSSEEGGTFLRGVGGLEGEGWGQRDADALFLGAG